LSPIHTEEGVFVIAAVRDVSERRRVLEEENRRMLEANRLKSEFLANMSHELRTPLNAIIGFSELMVHEKVGPVSADHKEYLGDILSSARHLLQLINDVLDLTKVEAGKMQFRPEKVDLNRSITEVKEILRGIAGPKKLDLRAEVDPSLGMVVLDHGKLKQVLYNFLSNSIKFTPEGGKVTVRALPEGPDHFRLEVEDTGIGIQEKDMHKLFIEFQQLDQGVSKKYAGTGLGLALTKRLVESQGGTVTVKSVYGKGSLFTATLPRDASRLTE
jgi:signal transduction histidine kinase